MRLLTKVRGICDIQLHGETFYRGPYSCVDCLLFNGMVDLNTNMDLYKHVIDHLHQGHFINRLYVEGIAEETRYEHANKTATYDEYTL